jgi:hypothetical protein
MADLPAITRAASQQFPAPSANASFLLALRILPRRGKIAGGDQNWPLLHQDGVERRVRPPHRNEDSLQLLTTVPCREMDLSLVTFD